MCECCRPGQADVESNSSNKIHQTWGRPPSTGPCMRAPSLSCLKHKRQSTFLLRYVSLPPLDLRLTDRQFLFRVFLFVGKRANERTRCPSNGIPQTGGRFGRGRRPPVRPPPPPSPSHTKRPSIEAASPFDITNVARRRMINMALPFQRLGG